MAIKFKSFVLIVTFGSVFVNSYVAAVLDYSSLTELQILGWYVGLSFESRSSAEMKSMLMISCNTECYQSLLLTKHSFLQLSDEKCKWRQVYHAKGKW